MTRRIIGAPFLVANNTLDPVGLPNTSLGDVGIPWIIARNAAGLAVPADTTEDILAQISIPPNVTGVNGFFEIFTHWTFTNNGNNKTARIRFGTIAGTAYLSQVMTTAVGAQFTTYIANRGAANSQVGASVGSVDGATGLVTAKATGSIDTAAAALILITGQKASGADTMTLESYMVKFYQGD